MEVTFIYFIVCALSPKLAIVLTSLVAAIPEMHKGDILGHEFCGIVEKIGPKVKKRKIGERAVASFQIACGNCYYCEKKLSSLCERTNGSTTENALYGRRTAGMSHKELPKHEPMNNPI